ncbi:group III truncated hemoglobin [Gelidibacter salicanalis]|uniref:Group III truncated hemoglobin n=1 Tax=Gelidibacter salicanalis TaxID=291193 RepID=A0A5C7AMY8_9FLAO|nr:group III truncated hemoglobin [Gelidibacter salicanalis]TXE09089.1 group III truncated hemoglobin [Gelidibacter salicanalis]
MEHDIFSLEDVKTLVNTFYDKVREDELLAPIFNKVIKDRWPAHLETMYTFWQTVLLGEHTYTGSPFPPHAKLPVSKAHFDRWLELFYSTIDEQFEGEIAEEAKWRASKMAEIFQFKIDRYQQSVSGHF